PAADPLVEHPLGLGGGLRLGAQVIELGERRRLERRRRGGELEGAVHPRRHVGERVEVVGDRRVAQVLVLAEPLRVRLHELAQVGAREHRRRDRRGALRQSLRLDQVAEEAEHAVRVGLDGLRDDRRPVAPRVEGGRARGDVELELGRERRYLCLYV
ncbi:MAG: hypothetical protein SGPRY_007601, partial [Prymnesium sp.]